MEKKTMGSFMAALRKANGLTQQQVADRLNVSNKTVSKWECDDGYPEITVLPALAEIYGVTVDELLRGERIVRDEARQNEKTEKQAEYLFKTAAGRFYTMSIVSVVICILALIVLLPLWSTALGLVLPVLVAGASVIVEFVAIMNFKPVLETSSDIVNKDLITDTKFKIRRFLVAVFSVVSLVLAVTVVPFLLGLWEADIAFIFSVCAFIIFGFSFHRFVGKKLQLDNVLSSKYIKFRKRTVKAVAVLIAVAFAVCTAGPFIEVYIEDSGKERYSFESEEYACSDARTDYYKLKNHILSDTELYYFSSLDTQPTAFCKVRIDAKIKDGEFVLTGAREEEWMHKDFETVEERDAFVKKYAVNEGVFKYVYASAWDGEKLIFDDEELEIYSVKLQIDWHKATNVLPEMMLTVFAFSLVTIAGAMCICAVRRKMEKT